MLHLDKETLRKLQTTQLEMLIEVDRICKKCDIKYNIIAGTLLGAVRHGGYIPWDDDADVAFLREEYEKFRIACDSELDKEKFYFQDHRNTKGYRWGYGKLRRKGTIFLRKNQEHMPYDQGVFIDVFPLDGVPNNYIKRFIHNFKCFCIRKILWSEIGKIEANNVFLCKLYEFLSYISRDKVLKYYESIVKKSNQEKTKWVRILLFPTPNYHFGYYRHWYENSSPIIFEKHIFQGIKDYKDYLMFKFGEYLELPLLKDRKSHPVSNIKLLEGEK